MTPRAPQHGASLVAAIVGLAVGAIAIAAIMATFASTEALKRNAIGVADAQQALALAAHAIAADLANAGHGFAAARRELATCPDTGDIRTSLRPLPVLITPGATVEASDSLVVSAAGGTAIAGALALAAAPGSGRALRLRAPLGVAVDDTVAVIGLDGSCAVTALVALAGPDTDGIVDAPHTGLDREFPASAVAVDLGPRSRWRRIRYDIADATLRSLDLAVEGASPNPLLSNAMLLKAQYGIDADGDGFLDAWLPASADPWTPESLQAAPVERIDAIKAVRFGLVVRSEVPDRQVTAPWRWELFDCGRDDPASCPGRLTGTLPAGWRYRTQEVVVPLANAILAGRL